MAKSHHRGSRRSPNYEGSSPTNLHEYAVARNREALQGDWQENRIHIGAELDRLADNIHTHREETNHQHLEQEVALKEMRKEVDMKIDNIWKHMNDRFHECNESFHKLEKAISNRSQWAVAWIQIAATVTLAIVAIYQVTKR